MRYITLRFECDGHGYKDGRSWSCGNFADHQVRVTVGPRGEMEIKDDDMPPGWSNFLEGQLYSNVKESEERNTVACPNCKVKY